MSPTSPQSPPKRPRLSLQIKALANGPSVRTSRYLAAAVDVTSPTAFNTLSNVYATAVDRSTPIQEAPPTARPATRRPMLKLQTRDVAASGNSAMGGHLLDTPLTARTVFPAVAKPVVFPSAMTATATATVTATPPLSAQPYDQGGAHVFAFDGPLPPDASPSAQQPTQNSSAGPDKRRTTMPVGSGAKLPYTHPRSLRSILRNSPLPPSGARSPESPRRQSRRLQEKARRRVAYHSPLEQEITTTRYTKSHIDLLAEEERTPISPSASSSSDDGDSLDLAMADSTRDGGHTPGPFEEMRRRTAGMHASSPAALSPTGGGIRKRGGGRRREKKRRWVWTIGQDEDGEDAASPVARENANVPPPPSVPLLSIPAPRRRTRSQQQAQAAEAAANPPADPPAPAQASAPPPAPHESRAEPQPQPATPPRDCQPRTARASTGPIPSRPSTPVSGDRGASSCATTPDGAIEPPTPGMESTTSVCSSQHSGRDDDDEDEDADGDADMSDASSFTSVEDGPVAAAPASSRSHQKWMAGAGRWPPAPWDDAAP
ncbi:hypothetical protein VTH06DRAFT_1734 [Thermothelomyces fergusii]